MRYSRHNRVAASEAIGAMLAIAMTLIAGAAAWSFARNQAGASESALLTNQLNTNDMLAEQFQVVGMYFGSTTSTTFITYNYGTITDQIASVRFYDSGGQVNLWFNSTGTGSSKADYVYDLRSTLATKCKTAASSYESPSVTKTTVHSTDEEFYTITIPGTTSNCPSFGQTVSATDTYTVSVTGVYGNVETFSQLG